MFLRGQAKFDEISRHCNFGGEVREFEILVYVNYWIKLNAISYSLFQSMMCYRNNIIYRW